jgi:hypothetical protein
MLAGLTICVLFLAPASWSNRRSQPAAAPVGILSAPGFQMWFIQAIALLDAAVCFLTFRKLSTQILFRLAAMMPNWKRHLPACASV